MKLTTVMRVIHESPWAILPSQLAVILEIARARVADSFEIDPEEIRDRLEAAEKEHGPRAGAFAADSVLHDEPGFVAVLPVYGVIMPHATMMTEMSGGTTVDELRSMFTAAMDDPQVKAVILDVDSPGGDATGLPELAAEMRAQRGRKPVVAVANYMMASGAYWVASQADEIVASPSAMVGSIGVYAAHEDMSEAFAKEGVTTTLVSAGQYKTEGNPYEPLSDEARAHVQEMVDGTYRLFVADIARGRETSSASVLKDYGEGRVFSAEGAMARGMVDRVESMPHTVARVIAEASAPRGRKRAAAAQWTAVPLPTEIAATLAPQHLYAGDYGVFSDFRVTTGAHTSSTPLPEIRTPADRREQMDAAHEEKETEVSTEGSPATAAQVDPELSELKTLVAGLTQAVQGMNEGLVDRETVDNMAEELTQLRATVDENLPKAGYLPADVGETLEHVGKGHRIGIAELHQLPSRKAAQMTRIPVDEIDEFHRVSDNLLILAAATKKDPRETAYFTDTYLPTMRTAMDSVTATEGDEFVPTLLSGNLIERVELQLRVVALFNQIDMPSNPYEIPGFGLRVRGGRASENTADTGQVGFRKVTPLTRKVTLTAVKFASEALVSKEAEEDSIIPILDFIRSELTSQMAHDQEDAVINGDTTGPHQDSDVTDALDPRKNWMGLRKLAVAGAKTDATNAILTAAMLRVNRKKMGKYGVASGSLVHILPIGSYMNLLSDANVLTVDKYGPNATIHSGEIASIDGIPIIVSEYARQDTNATGVYDGVTTNRGIALTVNPSGFLIGNRRGVTVQLLTELYAEYDQDAIAVSMRRAFALRYVATDPVVALTYNLA